MACLHRKNFYGILWHEEYHEVTSLKQLLYQTECQPEAKNQLTGFDTKGRFAWRGHIYLYIQKAHFLHPWHNTIYNTTEASFGWFGIFHHFMLCRYSSGYKIGGNLQWAFYWHSQSRLSVLTLLSFRVSHFPVFKKGGQRIFRIWKTTPLSLIVYKGNSLLQLSTDHPILFTIPNRSTYRHLRPPQSLGTKDSPQGYLAKFKLMQMFKVKT